MLYFLKQMIKTFEESSSESGVNSAKKRIYIKIRLRGWEVSLSDSYPTVSPSDQLEVPHYPIIVLTQGS